MDDILIGDEAQIDGALRRSSDALLDGLSHALNDGAIDARLSNASIAGTGQDLGCVVLRMHLYEILATYWVRRQTPAPASIAALRRALVACQLPPLTTLRARACERAACELGATVELEFAAPAIAVTEWDAPSGWVAFGSWAVALAPVALPGLECAASIKGLRPLDLARAASLAMLERKVDRAVSLVRWLPFVERGSRHASMLFELLAYLEQNDLQPPLVYQLALTRSCLGTP